MTEIHRNPGLDVPRPDAVPQRQLLADVVGEKGTDRSPAISPAFAPTHLHAYYQTHSKARYWARC